MKIGCSGKLKTRTYTTDDGNKVYVTEVEAKEILLLGTRRTAMIRVNLNKEAVPEIKRPLDLFIINSKAKLQ